MRGWTLAAALAVVGIAALAIGVAALYAGGPPPAPPRPRPAAAPAAAGAVLRYSPVMYQGLIAEDARKLGLPPPRIEALGAVFPYTDELPAPRTLRPGGALETRHLRLRLRVRREAGADGLMGGQGFRADHLVLAIENLTGRHVAYRVATRMGPTARCAAKGAIAHNAIALAPHEAVERTECLQHRGGAVEVSRVEVMELPPLSFYYVSRLTPELVLYDPRTAAGHTPPRGALCAQTFSWREIRDGADRGEIAWRDIVDFYARHSCDEYGIFAGYRYRDRAGLPLPARPPDGQAAPGGGNANLP